MHSYTNTHQVMIRSLAAVELSYLNPRIFKLAAVSSAGELSTPSVGFLTLEVLRGPLLLRLSPLLEFLLKMSQEL